MANTPAGTYVYGLVAASRRPPLARVPRGNKGMGRVRLLDVEPGRWLIVADAPLDAYGAEAINKNLGDLDYVSRAAVAHESVIEAFRDASAVVPMKLFTIFTSDARALEHIAAERARITDVIKRVANHLEWGVRVMLDSKGAPPSRLRRSGAAGSRRSVADSSGAAFLTRKKSERDLKTELASRAREVVDHVYDRFAALARLARRRTAAELPVQGGPLLLDAAFLVPKTKSGRFEKLGARVARDLARQGYLVTLTGPWPAYSFIQE
jgi:hypothetical protein